MSEFDQKPWPKAMEKLRLIIDALEGDGVISEKNLNDIISLIENDYVSLFVTHNNFDETVSLFEREEIYSNVLSRSKDDDTPDLKRARKLYDEGAEDSFFSILMDKISLDDKAKVMKAIARRCGCQ